MQTRKYLGKLHEFEHIAHVVALYLVITGALAEWIPTLIHKHVDINPEVTFVLHYLHYTSIALLFAYAVFQLVFSRRPSEEIRKLLAKDKPRRTAEMVAGASLLKGGDYSGRPVPAEDREFVTDPAGNLASILCKMNTDAYAGSVFEISRQEVAERNTAIIERNKVAFMLFRDPNRETDTPMEQSTMDDFVGYTAVFAVTKIGKDLYSRGLFPDRKFPATLVCRDGGSAAMLLFFAMHLRKPYRIDAVGQKYSGLLARCLEEHIKIAARAHANSGEKLEVWAQSEDNNMNYHYRRRGFELTKFKTFEGFPLYARSVHVV